MNTSNKTALITGASQGLGRTLASFLAAQGYTLFLTARTADTLTTTAASLRHLDPEIHTLPGDVADPAHRAALGRAIAHHGRLDLLINNASTLGPTPMPHLAHAAASDLAHIFAVNTIAPIALIQQLLPQLQVSKALIINISSDAAVGGYPGWGGYGASKAALDLFTRTLAAELEGVSAVSVDPGDMRTAMHQAAFPGEDISDRPLPEITLPFWAWLLGQPHNAINGQRFQAQAELWEVAA